MNDQAFKALLILLMCDDPSRLTSEQRTALEEYANWRAGISDCTSWIDAYHNLKVIP